MKKLILFAAVALFSVGTAFGQKFAYVDTEYILSKMPEYEAAQKRLNGFTEDWQKEVDRRVQEIEQMYKKYQAEQYLMDENTKTRRQDEIIKRENDLKLYQREIFGFEGELFKKRQELVKPIQDRVYNAIKDMAESKRLDFILDKSSGGAMMLYSNPSFDRSDEILKTLGY